MFNLQSMETTRHIVTHVRVDTYRSIFSTVPYSKSPTTLYPRHTLKKEYLSDEI
jgi:hypothetical protein